MHRYWLAPVGTRIAQAKNFCRQVTQEANFDRGISYNQALYWSNGAFAVTGPEPPRLPKWYHDLNLPAGSKRTRVWILAHEDYTLGENTETWPVYRFSDGTKYVAYYVDYIVHHTGRAEFWRFPPEGPLVICRAGTKQVAGFVQYLKF